VAGRRRSIGKRLKAKAQQSANNQAHKVLDYFIGKEADAHSGSSGRLGTGSRRPTRRFEDVGKEPERRRERPFQRPALTAEHDAPHTRYRSFRALEDAAQQHKKGTGEIVLRIRTTPGEKQEFAELLYTATVQGLHVQTKSSQFMAFVSHRVTADGLNGDLLEFAQRAKRLGAEWE